MSDDAPADAEEPPVIEKQWLIWSSYHNQWWGPGGRNYTRSREEAGRYTGPEALAVYYHSARGWTPGDPFPISITLVPA